MATGRRDYTTGFQSESLAEGRYCQSIVKYQSKTCEALHSETVLTYNVPAGYRLGMNRIGITSRSQATHYMWVLIGSTGFGDLYFSVSGELVFSDMNPLYVSGGETVSVKVYNYDDITAAFLVTLVGVLEKLS